MTDVDFGIDGMASGRHNIAAIRAIGVPILGGSAVRRLGETDRLKSLQRAWRAKVVELRAAGWGPAQGINFQVLRNCPPVGCRRTRIDGRQLRHCDQRVFCPYCFARAYAVKPYKLLAACLNQGKTYAIYHRRLWLVEWRAWHRYLGHDLPETSELFPFRRDRERFLVETVAGYQFRCLDYEPDGYVVRRAGLFLCPPHADVDRLRRRRMVRVHELITGRILANAVARVSSYPSGLWHQLPELELVDVLQSIRGSRLLSLYGQLRRS